MHAIDKVLQHLETECDRLEISLENQYQSLKSSLIPDTADDGEMAQLVEDLRSVEAQLAGLVQTRHDDPMLPVAAGSDATGRAARARRRVLQLLTLVERNAAQCRELQGKFRDALRELQAGGQYLQSVRSCRENRPRYLDARQ